MQNPCETFAHLSPQEKKRRLSQYRRLLREIYEDRRRLAQLAGRLLRHNPAGLPLGEVNRYFSGYEARINENVARCAALVEELQTFINGIEDSEMRSVFTLRYVNGYTWRQIAFALHHYEESFPRKKHDRYLARLGKIAIGEMTDMS